LPAKCLNDVKSIKHAFQDLPATLFLTDKVFTEDHCPRIFEISSF